MKYKTTPNSNVSTSNSFETISVVKVSKNKTDKRSKTHMLTQKSQRAYQDLCFSFEKAPQYLTQLI